MLLKYGSFIQAIIDFAIIAFCVFLLVRALNSMQKPVSTKPSTAIPVWPVGVMNGPSEMVGTERLVVGYFPTCALAASTFAHLALTAARMFALPAADIFRFFLGAGADVEGVAGTTALVASAVPFFFAHLAF